jgi:signal transduction histidine kinase/streptogramin lyase
VDDQKIIWVGTSGKGLVKCNTNSPKFQYYPVGSSNADNLIDNNITSVYEDDLNNIWIGTGSGDLYKFDIHSESFKSILKHKIKSKIHTIVKDKQNRLWIGTLGEGIKLLDLKTEKLVSSPRLPDYNFHQAKRITNILEDRKGNIWIATDGAGLIRYNKSGNNFTNLTFDSTAEFSSAYIWTLFEDSEGIIWIGTWDYGTSFFDYSTEKFTDVVYQKEKPGTIAGPNVVSIAEDDKGNLWFGTWGNGFSILSKDKKKTPSFTNFGTESGISNNFVVGLLPFTNNRMWVTTTAGITLININDNTWQEFSDKQGVFNSEFNLGSLYKTQSGKYCFGAINGLYTTDDSLFNKNGKVPAILITSVKLFNNDLRISKKDKADNGYNPIELSHNENFLNFEFMVLDYIDPTQNRFMYKMEGLDKAWINSGRRNFVSYAGLAPGKYIFRVKGSDSNLNWNDKGASIAVIIKPPFWRTWWAYTSYIIAFIGVLYFIRNTEIKRRRRKEEERLRREREEARLREAELKAKNIEQEKEIEKQKIRNRIAQDLHDEIGSNLSSISLMSELIQKDEKLNQKISEKLNRIYKVARGSTQAMRDIVWLTNPSSDSLRDLIVKMREVADNTLGKFNLNFNYPKDVAEVNLLPETKRNIFFIYKETLNNIVKHAEAQSVEIELDIKDHEIFFSIKDDGIGFNTSASFNGNGLKNIKARAKEINADLSFESSPGRGSLLKLSANITQLRD